MQRTRESAIASAVEKAKNETGTNSAAAPNMEEIAKKHAQEIEALRAEHEAAVAVAKSEATNAPSDGTTKAAIEAAITAHNKEMQAKHADEISAAVERGRMEQAAKSKLKDAQLVRSQNKVKELEAQVMEWRKAGLVPDTTTPAASAAAPSSSSAAPPVTPTMPVTPTAPVASTSKVVAPTAPAAAPAPPASATTPAAPSASANMGPARRVLGGAVPLGPSDGASRGRGAPRGRGRGISIRGAAPGAGAGAAVGRGAVTGTGPSPTAAAGPSAAVGVQIMGAANKRGREDEVHADDSLAKRLKPAGEGAVAGSGSAGGVGGTASMTAAGGSKPPVTLRRPPP